jgi:septal ring factor EnvC (AmiA/AmiB activator)
LTRVSELEGTVQAQAQEARRRMLDLEATVQQRKAVLETVLEEKSHLEATLQEKAAEIERQAAIAQASGAKVAALQRQLSKDTFDTSQLEQTYGALTEELESVRAGGVKCMSWRLFNEIVRG